MRLLFGAAPPPQGHPRASAASKAPRQTGGLNARKRDEESDEMSNTKFIEIDGRRFLWRDVLKLRREQKQASAKAAQPALFELVEDRRPPADRTAAGRYLEPSLFSLFDRENR
jgi:hypothetical protein